MKNRMVPRVDAGVRVVNILRDWHKNSLGDECNEALTLTEV